MKALQIGETAINNCSFSLLPVRKGKQLKSLILSLPSSPLYLGNYIIRVLFHLAEYLPLLAANSYSLRDRYLEIPEDTAGYFLLKTHRVLFFIV